MCLENQGLYREMASLVKHYTNRLYDDDGALWEFLANLVESDREISVRYAAVCMRHEWIRISKNESNYAAKHTELSEERFGKSTDYDTILDLRLALETISEQQRTVILLKYYWGFTLEEIAVLTGVSRQAVSQMIRRALRTLKKSLSA